MFKSKSRFNFVCFFFLAFVSHVTLADKSEQSIFDKSRDRNIPVTVSKPINSASCTQKNQCPVAIISAGYGIKHTQYQFIETLLKQRGFLTIAVGHELPSDPPLSVTGNLYQTRSENWQRGAATLRFVRSFLGEKFTGYNFNTLTLIGHSNGGDISSWLANENVDFIERVITIDHRRVPLPRNHNIKVLSIRGSDFPADEGVLYTPSELSEYPVCIVKIDKSRHNDMYDGGPTWLKEAITDKIALFLTNKPCDNKR